MSDSGPSPENESLSTKLARHRSPNYPAFDLGVAISRVRLLYERERRGSMNAKVAIQHWGYSEKSSGGQTALGALKAFGLINDSGEGPTRTVQVTDLALRIILDDRPNSTERRDSIRRAALSPKIHAQVWKDLDGNLGSDGNLRHRLIFDYGFNENTVTAFIREFRATLAFADILQSDSLSVIGTEEEGLHGSPEESSTMTSNFQTFQSESTPAAVESRAKAIPPQPQLQPGFRQDVFSLSEGAVSIQWPETLSKDSFEDLSAWLDILKRKIGRSVKDENQATTSVSQ